MRTGNSCFQAKSGIWGKETFFDMQNIISIRVKGFI